MSIKQRMFRARKDGAEKHRRDKSKRRRKHSQYPEYTYRAREIYPSKQTGITRSPANSALHHMMCTCIHISHKRGFGLYPTSHGHYHLHGHVIKDRCPINDHKYGQ